MPPEPKGETISYTPIHVPVWKTIRSSIENRPSQMLRSHHDHHVPALYSPLNRTISLVIVARKMARRLPSRDQRKPTTLRPSANGVS
jgi:hypothetical protein